MAAAALSELEATPMSLNTLGRSMAALMNSSVDAELIQNMHKLLMDLDETGLISITFSAPTS